MEYTVSHIFIIIVPVVNAILYLLSKGLLIISVVAFSFFIIFIIYIYNNSDRKEPLNIISSNGKVYFNLSDDQLFSVILSKEQSLSELIEETISKEMATLKDMVDSINFINFSDETLHRELNKLVQN